MSLFADSTTSADMLTSSPLPWRWCQMFLERDGRWRATQQSREFLTSLHRFYNNAYADAEKQDAINLSVTLDTGTLGQPQGVVVTTRVGGAGWGGGAVFWAIFSLRKAVWLCGSWTTTRICTWGGEADPTTPPDPPGADSEPPSTL